jgi:hypothetical protein
VGVYAGVALRGVEVLVPEQLLDLSEQLRVAQAAVGEQRQQQSVTLALGPSIGIVDGGTRRVGGRGTIPPGDSNI